MTAQFVVDEMRRRVKDGFVPDADGRNRIFFGCMMTLREETFSPEFMHVMCEYQWGNVYLSVLERTAEHIKDGYTLQNTKDYVFHVHQDKLVELLAHHIAAAHKRAAELDGYECTMKMQVEDWSRAVRDPDHRALTTHVTPIDLPKKH